MSSISAGTTTGTALVQTGDTTGNLVIKTGANATTAMTISGTDQSITVAGGLNLGAPVAVASGGTGANTASAARTNLGLAIGTDVLAPNGSGASLTSLNASSVSSGTLAVAQGGTGTASPSLVGGTNITISGTWPNQTVTAAGGGVTSLNGQTGAITNTDLYAIGSYINARPRNTTNYSPNSTLAGSSLYAGLAGGVWYSGDTNNFVYWNALTQGTYGVPSTLINTGTWRCISQAYVDGTSGITGLWVRIS